jgi:murein L,D-transpeptidase YcbB/YkuD
MNAASEKWVTLEKAVPVVISYFTAWVDGDGVLNFREDIYHHDQEMAERMFIRARREAVASRAR